MSDPVTMTVHGQDKSCQETVAALQAKIQALEVRLASTEEKGQFLQATLDALAAKTVVLAPDGKILYLNAAWWRFSLAKAGILPTAYLGELYLTICEQAIGMAASAVPLAATGINAVITGQQAEFTLEYPCRSGETTRWFILRVTPFAETTPRRVVITHTDITARKQAQEAEYAQRCFAEALRDSLAALTSSLDVECVMEQILAAAATVVPSEAGSILLVEEEQGRIAYSRGFAPEAEAFFKDYRFSHESVTTTGSFAHTQPYIVFDTQSCASWLPLPSTEWIRSSIGVPIEIRGEVIGLLVADSAVANHLQLQDVEKLQAFARYAGLALENAYHVSRLEQRVAERTAELQVAKEQTEAILHNSLDGIVVVHPDLRIKQMNYAFSTLVACPPTVDEPQSLLRFIHEDDVQAFMIGLQAVIREQAGRQLEVRACRTDGHCFEAELSIGLLKADGLVCIIRDITERKRAQIALAEERNLLRTLIDAIPDVIYVKDITRRFVLRNKAQGLLLPTLAPEDLIGKTNWDILPPALAEACDAEEEMVLRTGKPVNRHDMSIVHADGRVSWASTIKVPLHNLTGAIIGLAGVAHDITQRKQDEQQLRFYASLQENVSDAVITTDLDFRIQSWNRAAETIYGWSAAEVIGKAIGDILRTYPSAEERQHAKQELFRLGCVSGEALQYRKDDTPLYILYSVTLLKDQQGVPYGVVAVNHDIARHKEAEAALQQALQKEKELSELKSRFVSMASHEFRTPLTTILVLTETLRTYRHKLTDEQIAQRLGTIQSQVDHLKSIMDDVLQLSQLQARRGDFNLVALNLDSLCSTIFAELQNQPEVAARLHYLCHGPIPPIKADQRLMRQTITNLVTNALKYSPAEKNVHVTLSSLDMTLILQVQDEGIGIPEADLQHLFQPFHRAGNVGGISGTGLGLVITKEAVERHGGTISVQSEVGVGTTFTICLPLAYAE